MTERWGAWNCTNCGEMKISGKYKTCPNCEDPRSERLDVREMPYFDPNGEIITDSVDLEFINAGPAWNCGVCAHDNKGDTKACWSCDRPRDADDVYNQTIEYSTGVSYIDSVDTGERPRDLTYEEWTGDSSTQMRRILDDKPIESRHYVAHEPPPTEAIGRKWGVKYTVESESLASKYPPRNKWERFYAWFMFRFYWIAGGATALLVIWLVFFSFFQTKSYSGKVVALEWERQVEVEEYRTLVESDWNVPLKGREINRTRKVHHYDSEYSHTESRQVQKSRQVQSGSESYSYSCGTTTTSNGNGSFSTSTQYCTGTRPTYSTEYYTETAYDDIYIDVPVYKTWYRYEIERWVTDFWVPTGDDTSDSVLDDPFWADPILEDDLHRLGDGRQQEYLADLSIIIDQEAKIFEAEVNLDFFIQLQTESLIVAEINRQDKVRSVYFAEEGCDDCQNIVE